MTRKRAAFWVLLHLLLAAGAGLLASGLESDSRASIFLRRSDPVRQDYERLAEVFGPDTFVVVTCRGDGDSFRGRVEELAGALRACDAVAAVEVPVKGSPLAQSLKLLGPGRVSLAVTLAGGAPGRDAVDAVKAAVARFGDLDVGIAGQPVLNRALQQASDTVGRTLFPLLALVMAALLSVAYRSLRVTAAVLLVTATVLLAGMAFLALAGEPINLVTILLPVLLLALTVALCIHMVNAYRRFRSRGLGARAAVRRMRREEFQPCLVTSLTTAAGFGSFGLSRIEPLRVLGMSMAFSILAAFFVAYTLLPALLVLGRPRPRDGLRIGEGLVALVPPLVRRRGLVLAGFLLLVAAGLAVAPRIPRETNGLRYLAASHPLRVESERLAAEGVGTASLELVLRGASDRPLGPLLGRIHQEIEGWRDGPVRGLVSPRTLAREGAFRLARGTLENGGAHAARFLDPASGSARVSLRIDPVDVAAYGGLRERLEDAARAAGAPFTITGEFAVVMTVQQELLRTLLVSLAGTALTILAVLAIAQRSLRLAVLTMIPALAPLAFVLLACAVSGAPLSIATVMVLAVSLGIVTDDSVHMLHAFRKGHRLDECLQRVGTALTETSLAIFLGFAVLGFAAFVPTRDFGLLTAGATLVALAADLLLFPVLLHRTSPARRRLSRSPSHETLPA